MEGAEMEKRRDRHNSETFGWWLKWSKDGMSLGVVKFLGRTRGRGCWWRLNGSLRLWRSEEGQLEAPEREAVETLRMLTGLGNQRPSMTAVNKDGVTVSFR